MKLLQFTALALAAFFCSVKTVHAADYYWVGGSGNWSEYASHWATTSGGNVFHLQAPTVNDDVYFDVHSFSAVAQSVVVDSHAFCHNMIWNGVAHTPAFAMATTLVQLTVSGSLTLDTAMTVTLFNGTLVFSSSAAGETIATAGNALPCLVDFNGTGGAWTLTDALTTTNRITLTAGTLETNNYPIHCSSFESVSGAARAFYPGTSTVTISGDSISTYDWNIPSTVTLDAANAVIRLHDNTEFYSKGQIYNIIEWVPSAQPTVSYNVLYDDSLQANKVISRNPNDWVTMIVNCSNSLIDSLISNSYMMMNGSGNTFQDVFVRHDLYNIGSNSYQNLLGATIYMSSANSFGTITATDWLDLSGNNIAGSIFAAGQVSLNGVATINKLEVKGDAFIAGQQDIDTLVLWSSGDFAQNDHRIGLLTLTGGNIYTFASGKTQTIDSLAIRGIAAYTELIASNLNTIANVVINKPLCTDSLSIRSVHASGNSALYAGDNSVSVNSAGWIFDTCMLAPDCFIAGNRMICDGESAAFTAAGGIAYAWAGPAGFSATAASTGAITVAGAYSVTITQSTGATVSCSETLIVKPACNDNIVCTSDTCNPYLGCSFATLNCDDGHVCTEDVCDPLSGCIHTPVPGCNDACDTLVCDDNDGCTADTCDNGVCIFTAIICDDNDICTYDECIAYCSHSWLYCDDNNACTIDACNSTSTGCDRTPVTCDDGDACTVDQCDTVLSCVSTPLNCDDGDACTSDGCDSISGCTTSTIPGCNNPCDTLVCDDNNVCTMDSCFNGNCMNHVIDCDDGTVCTTDGCDSVSAGCMNIPVNCDDGVGCTIDNCHAVIGCTHNSFAVTLSFSVTPASCDTCADGAATVFASNGTGPYSFLWNTIPPQTTQTITNLPGGNVSVCVTDNNNCMQCDTITVPEYHCSAEFTLYPDTLPQHYYVVNGASGTPPLLYVWMWGDGDSDSTAYPSHTYSTAGTYTICLYITDSDGCTDSLCTPYMLTKDGGAMIFVQVVDSLPFTAIHDVTLEELQLYPNPTAGSTTLKAQASKAAQAFSIKLFDSLGKELWQQQHAGNALQQGLTIDFSSHSAGIYFLHVQGAGGNRVMKVVRY